MWLHCILLKAVQNILPSRQVRDRRVLRLAVEFIKQGWAVLQSPSGALPVASWHLCCWCQRCWCSCCLCCCCCCQCCWCCSCSRPALGELSPSPCLFLLLTVSLCCLCCWKEHDHPLYHVAVDVVAAVVDVVAVGVVGFVDIDVVGFLHSSQWHFSVSPW